MECKYLCPIMTSVDKVGNVNFDEMHALYDQILKAGIDGILVGGSSGEFYAFTYDEMKVIITDAIKHIKHRGFVLASTGRMVESETISLSNYVLDSGADAVIIVGPYYTACSQEDIFHYYDTILDQIHGDVYLYNYAERTGYDVSAETIIRLRSRHKNFAGVKDTHQVLRHTQRYIQKIKPLFPDFKVFTGYDNHCIPVVISGGDGCVGALSNIIPEICHKVALALRNEDVAQLQATQREIDKYFEFFEVYTPFNPVMKWAMKELGKPMQEYCKTPLTVLTKEAKKDLADFAQLWRAAKPAAKAKAKTKSAVKKTTAKKTVVKKAASKAAVKKTAVKKAAEQPAEKPTENK